MDRASPASARERRPLGIELALVAIVSLIVLVPGIQNYSLVDPWETHYGEVARSMLHDRDFVRTQWNGTFIGEPGDIEGFRSKPVMSFWMMAAGMWAMGLEQDGGYSGEMVEDARTMIGIRLPFICSAVAGLMLLWWMLAHLVSRRLAWLALLVVGTTPFFCLVARQGIPDMPLLACTMGALALFALAVEDGERPISVLGQLRFGRRRIAIDARHLVVGAIAAFVVVQAIYYAVHFSMSPPLAVRSRLPSPAFWLPALMLLLLGGLHRNGWLILRFIPLVIGGIIAVIVGAPVQRQAPGQPLWSHVFDNILRPWDRYAADRYLVRAIVVAGLWLARAALVGGQWPERWARAHHGNRLRDPWQLAGAITDRLLEMSPLSTMRQVYLLGCYFLLGISVLVKGPPALAIVGGVVVFHTVLLGRWEALGNGAFEIKRGALVMIATFLPWHLAMYLRDGVRFVDEYVFTHVFNRAVLGVDNSPGTFGYYTSQIGHGMWLWAALLPAALAATLLRTRSDTREGRVRFLIALWAIVAVAFFSLVQTKFHHYILPAIPALAILVAFFLDDLVAGRDRLHPVFALLGAAIVLLICRDLMFEPERWIEMFVFRYDRPWPAGAPWLIDPSDGFLGLGIAGAIAVALAATRWPRVAVACLGAAGLAICIWSLQVYMPIAGTHWGMRDAIRTYYKQRTVYGAKLVYFGPREVYDDWHARGDKWSFRTFVPDDLHVGQPMTITVQVHKGGDAAGDTPVIMLGKASEVGDNWVEVTLAPGERDKLAPLIEQGQRSRPARPPLYLVDADRLLAWQLYWRGEQFWSGGEIWGYVPEMKTSFPKTDNKQLQKYLGDRARAPLGRRYFVVTEAGRINGMQSLLPESARSTYSVLDTTSNKFSLAVFSL